jgi:hypothetical protein
LRATAKRIAARRRGEAEPEGSPAKSPDGRPFPPPPKLGGSDAPHVWAAQVLKAQSPFCVGPTQGPQKMYAVRVLGIDGVWRDHRVFANRADAERSVIRFEAEGFRAKIYRTSSSWPIEEDVEDNHHRRHTWEVSVSGRAM